MLRRRPLYLVAAGLAIAIGAVLAAWLVTRLGDDRPVLALRQPVSRGELITAEHLMTVRLGPDPALRVVPESARGSVVGRYAAVDLAAGGLLVEDSYVAEAPPLPGQSLVGVWLAPGQQPGTTLRAGDRVRVVSTPRSQDDAPAGAPRSVPAVVVAAEDAEDGHQLVTVSVPSGTAPGLGALVATGRIALVLDAAATTGSR